tara:strand:+ start:133 stop:369 length:237 start_codon:yes stop_codon:yes gene_type:complete
MSVEKQKNRIKEQEVCNICGEKGIDETHDLYDCTENWEEENGIPRGTWMLDWLKNMKKNEKEKKKQQGGFRAWSKQFN